MVGVIQFKFPLSLSNEIISPLELLKITLSSFKITDVSFCELINFFLPLNCHIFLPSKIEKQINVLFASKK